MTRSQKLIGKIKGNPRQVRFAELQLLLFAEGFIKFNQRVSHITYHHRLVFRLLLSSLTAGLPTAASGMSLKS